MTFDEILRLQQLKVLYGERYVDGNLHFRINFKTAEEKCPELLETLVLSGLNEIEKWSYREGLMAYIITDEGDLVWKRTKRML